MSEVNSIDVELAGQSWKGMFKNKELRLTSAPQGKVYVVEKEWNNE